MNRLTCKSEITGLPMVRALAESCGEDSCADACAEYGEKNCTGCPIEEAITRLAAYEDTGLTPEEVAELAEAKQEGRLILPPCDENDYRGLKVKYRVFKVRNNEPIENCFVLRPDKDPAARAALECYANKTPNDQLAWDILKWLESMGGEKD